MRLIDADALKEKILAERDAIPKTVIERYSFGVETPNHSGVLIRGGIRKALRCMEQCPTIDPESLRKKGEWIIMSFWKKRRGHHVQYVVKKCSMCNFRVKARWENNFCPNCGADMRGTEDAENNFRN